MPRRDWKIVVVRDWKSQINAIRALGRGEIPLNTYQGLKVKFNGDFENDPEVKYL
jgi:hypothetical protein